MIMIRVLINVCRACYVRARDVNTECIVSARVSLDVCILTYQKFKHSNTYVQDM
jgi:hypothetical protein